MPTAVIGVRNIVTESGVERRLTAILYADVAGYSRLTGDDEEATHQTLRRYLDTISEAVRNGGGRVVHYAGDAVLAEFSSVVSALTSAVAIQADLGLRNQDLAPERRVEFRIGLNLGEVIVDQGDIYGDGVNVAARLEALAEPGGICLSGEVHRQVEGKVDLGFDNLGPKQVKNIAKPVQVFRVRPASSAATPPAGRSWWRWAAAAVVVLAAAGTAALYLRQTPQVAEPPPPAAASENPLAGPSLAVLPFSDASAEAGQKYFAEGIAEDLITDLSKVPGLFVIARNTTFAYQGRKVTAQQVAADLGVRYVLEGNVRRAGKQVRINVQLADTASGGLLWAERYDGALTNVFALQDEIGRKIVAALKVKLPGRQQALQRRGETQSPEAYDAFLRGWGHYRRGGGAELAKALPFLQRAIALDAKFGRAHAALAAVYWQGRGQGLAAALEIEPSELDRRAERHLEEARKQPTGLAHQVASRLLSARGEHTVAITEAETAIQLDPADPAGFRALNAARRAAGQTAAESFR
jgi:TolB-like protein/class 3 adenylate cyclase